MSRSKDIGTWAETQTVRAFERAGIPAHRPGLRGVLDHGDVWAANGAIVVEVKAGEQTRKPSWTQLTAWWQETLREADRVPACDVALLVLRRWGSGKAEDWTAYISVADLMFLAGNEPPHGWAADIPVAVPLHHLLPLAAARYTEVNA